ncbi:hypothetical protein M108_0977 [Bacteroides fragilis str. 3397 T14]|nr:hypothetical protein M108_0977 [Bacteroides fragilis str. 3397 T14]
MQINTDTLYIDNEINSLSTDKTYILPNHIYMCLTNNVL